jgi:hypothetical protein
MISSSLPRERGVGSEGITIPVASQFAPTARSDARSFDNLRVDGSVVNAVLTLDVYM